MNYLAHSTRLVVFGRLLLLFIIFVLRPNSFVQAQQTSNGMESYTRLAVLHGVYENNGGKNIHSDEYDSALKQLNWSVNKFASTKSDMDRLMAAFDRNEFDMAILCPLFNYEKDVVDMTQYGSRFRKFVENGGALIIFDAMYPQNLKWLMSVDSSLKIDLEECKAAADIENTLPVNSIRFLPNLIRESNTWGHLVLPEGHGWDIVAKCSEGEPQIVMKRLGKGYVYVCGPRFGGASFLENFRANLELQRLGLTVEHFERPQFSIGDGVISISLKSVAGAASGKTVVSIVPVENQESKKTFQVDFSIKPNETAEIRTPFQIAARGPVRVSFALVGAETDQESCVILFDNVVAIPDFLTFSGPAYRGFAVESELKKNNGRILTTVDLAPDKESLETLEFQAVVKSADGEFIGNTGKLKVPELYFKLPITIGTPAPGAYKIIGTLFENGKVLAEKSVDLTVLTDKECPVYINSDLNLVTDGQEFFPIGIYHINPKDLDQAAPLGFNTVQMFSWFVDEAFTEPAKYDMRVIYEENHRLSGEDWVGQNAVELAQKYSNALIWYGMDEPNEQTYHQAKGIHDVYHKFDKGRPTYCVSCKPPLFPEHVALGDIFAVDPYPVPNCPISMVSDWMERAQAAAKGEKPVFCVPQSFGSETSEALRAMTYQAIVHEARGIIWYPWDDGGKSGLKYHPNLHPTFKTLISEIKTLVPALLNKTGREQIHSDNRLVHGLFCQETPDKRFLLLVNPETTDQTLDLTKFGQLKNAKELRDVFDGQTASPNVPLILKSYQTRAFEIR